MFWIIFFGMKLLEHLLQFVFNGDVEMVNRGFFPILSKVFEIKFVGSYVFPTLLGPELVHPTG